MSERATDTDGSAARGTKDDRQPSRLQQTGTGGVLGLVIGLADWGIKCHTAGHYVPPDNALVEIGGSIVGVPFALWFGDVFSTIGDIITDWLHNLKQKGIKP